MEDIPGTPSSGGLSMSRPLVLLTSMLTRVIVVIIIKAGLDEIGMTKVISRRTSWSIQENKFLRADSRWVLLENWNLSAAEVDHQAEQRILRVAAILLANPYGAPVVNLVGWRRWRYSIQFVGYDWTTSGNLHKTFLHLYELYY
jgi:hypothetical protein